jgi:hypothetical protein
MRSSRLTVGGFHVAMLCAGLLGAFAAALLVVVRPQRAGLSR